MQQLPDLYPVEGIVDPQPVTPQAPDLPDLFPDGMEPIRPDARARQAKLLKPDTAVRDLQLARDAGLAPELVERNRDDITLKADVDRMNAALVGAPGLRAYIHQSPHKMAAVADDVDTLAEIERTVQKGISTLGTTGNAVLRFGPNIEQAASDIIGLVAGTVDSAVRGTAQLTGLQAGGLFGDIRDWALQHSADMQDYKDEYLDNLPPELKGRLIDNPQYLLDPQWLLQNVGDGAASLVPVIVATVLTGGSTLVGGLVGGLMEGASQYRELMEKGADPDSSALYSQAFIPVVAALNKLGLDVMLSTRLASTWLQRAGKALAAAGAEGLTEYAEEPFSAFFSSLARGDDYDTTVGNIWKSFENVETLFVGGILGGGVNVMHTAREQAIAHRAEQEQQILDALTQNIMQTKLGQLDPLLLEEAVRAIKAGGQITEIYVPASAVASNFGEDMQGLGETLNQLGVSVDQYGNALTAGGDLVIPVEKYAAVVAANPEFAARFANDRRLTPDGLTRNEAVQAQQDFQAETARLVEMLKEDREAANEYETEIRGIQDEVLAMRQQTGLVTDAMRADARMTAATFGVLARMNNVTPTELWQAYGPQIQRGGQAAVDQQTPIDPQTLATLSTQLSTLQSAWDRANRTGRNVEWMASAAEANPIFESLGPEAMNIPAHGMAKAATLQQGLKDLLNILNNGLDPSRALYTAGLTAPTGSGAGTGTAGGYAYRDGPFIITFREGVVGSPTNSDITGVLVNSAHPELVAPLQQMFPNLVIRDYNNVADVVSASRAGTSSTTATTEQKTPSTQDLLDVHEEQQDFDKGKMLTRSTYEEKDGIGYSTYINPETGIVDVYLAGFSGTDFYGYMRVYENGKPTNKFTSKLARETKREGASRAMISRIVEMLPEGHMYMENDTISIDGMRHFENQLRNGYTPVLDQAGKIETSTARLSNAGKTSLLEGAESSFTGMEIKTEEQFEKVRQQVAPYLEKLGLDPETSTRWDGTNAVISMPVLQAPRVQRGGQAAVDQQALQQDAAYAGVENEAEVEEAGRLWAEMGTESPYFKRWSGGAPVVRRGQDHDFQTGQPVVVESLHGTLKAGFDQFAPSRKKPTWTTNSPEYADAYAGGDYQLFSDRVVSEQDSPAVYPVFLRMDNPLDLRHLGDLEQEVTLEDGVRLLFGMEDVAEFFTVSRGYLRDVSGMRQQDAEMFLREAGLEAVQTKFGLAFRDSNGLEVVYGRNPKIYRSLESPEDFSDFFVEPVLTDLERKPTKEEVAAIERFKKADDDNKRMASMLGSIEEARYRGKEDMGPLYELARYGASFWRDMGYDGVIAQEQGNLSFGVFDPTQIKSVNNRGTFDPADPRILKQAQFAGATTLEEIREAGRLWAEMGTESPYFKRWFGESKVVDESGKPLVVYHGSSKDFASFDPALAGTLKYSDWGPGIYFTPSKWQADGYSEDARKETDAEAKVLWDEYEAKAKEFGTTPMNASIDLGFGTDKYNELGAYYDKWAKRRKEVAAQPNKTYSVYLSLKNPYIYIASGMTDPSLAERAKSRGHDGIIVRREDGSVDEIVAFNPTQIKSVNNRGTFDPADPRILKQAQFAGATTLEEIREAGRLWAEMGTESPYFKRWSGGAPVVLKNAAPSFTTGQAVVVEADHGSPDIRFVQEDGVFKSEKERYGFGRSEAAHWFTRDTATAKTYADPRRAFDYQNAEPGVIPAYVRLDNPLVIDAAGQNWRDAQKRGKTSGVIAEARANGHDGVIIYNVKDDYNNDKKTRPTTTLTVFSSTQIKSVNNRGTFDPADARILNQSLSPEAQAMADRIAQALNQPVGPEPDADIGVEALRKVNEGQTLFQQQSPLGFVSAVETAITGMDFKTMPGKDLANRVKKTAGIKAEELEDLGLIEWLEGAGKVTKDQVMAFVRNGGPQIEEVVKGRGDQGFYTEETEDGWGVWDKNDNFIDGYATEAEALSAIKDFNESGPDNTKFSQYTLPGGENYREVLMTLPRRLVPDGEGDVQWNRNSYESSHWDEPDVLAHFRLNDRTGPNGEKILFIEEIQSDWHQEGRKKGYDSPAAERKKLERLQALSVKFDRGEATKEEQAELEQLSRERSNRDLKRGVPDAPFKKSWNMLAMKRILRMAAEQGYDSVAWTPGEVQAERYDLSKQVESIGYQKRGDLFNVTVWDKRDRQIYTNQSATADELENVVGKEIAQKMVDGVGRQEGQVTYLEDLDLKVGGEGMKGFYDKILPAEVNKYAKKWGVKVGATEIKQEYQPNPLPQLFGGSASDIQAKTYTVWTLPITDQMRQDVLQGQPLYQNQAEPQAAFTFKTASGKPLIELFQKANQSSFLHETGHLYLEMIRDLAIKADAPQAMRDLWTQAKTALKINDGPISREAHEEWSRNLEAYFAKGEAPAVGLRGLFARYADWLKSIYREVENIFAASGTQFNPDLKPIFDRLFATEQEIREAEAFYAAQRPFFDLADQMSDEDRAALQKLREKAQETSFDSRLRKLTEAYVKTQGGRKALADELRPEVEGRPVYRAIEAARVGGFELAEIDDLVGEETRKAISKKWKLVKVGGDLDPNVVAAQNGYNSAREMLMEMAAAPNKQEALKAAIDERVEAERQKILRGLMDADAVVAADEAYHNEDRLALLVAEFAVLAEQSSRRQGARARALDAAAAREVARQTMKELPLREAMNYQKFARAERKAAMQARDAKRAGKTAEALQAKRVELLNHALFMESMQLRGQIQKLEKAIKKGAKQKSMLPAAKDLLQGLGIQYGIMPYAKLKKGMAWAAYTQSFAAKGEDRPTLADWAAEREDEFGVYFDAFVLQNAGYVPLQDLTVEQFDAVRQAVNTIRTVDRNERTVLINGERIAMEEAEDRLEQSILGRKLNSTQRSKRKSGLRKTKARLHAFHAKMEAMLLDLDNWSHGHWWNMFFKPIADAENARSERLKEVAAKIQTLFKPVKKGMGKRIFIQEINDSLRKSEILAIALNMGNEGNILRLRQGFQDWDMDALFQRMTQTEDLLTARDWKFVQDVWDYLDTFRPESFKLQKDLTGREPERIPPTPLDTMHGVLKGGYYPAVYDTDLNFTAFSREQKDLDKSLFGGRNYGAAMTKHSHLKERAQTGANQALSLELSVITDHVYNTVHDLTHRRAVVEVAKIMKRPKVRKMVEDALSPEAYREFMPWLQDIARERQEPMNQLHRAARWARKGTTIMQMGLKITTMITQPLGILQTLDVIGPKWTAAGLAHVYGNTHKIHRVYDEITAKSLFMANRIKSFDREVRDAMKGLTTADNFRRQVDEFAFKGIGFVQLGVDMPTWWGAYQKGLAENLGDEAKAVAYADSAVRISQGSGSTKDLARVQRGSEFQKLATMFYSYFSALYSLTYRRAGKTRSLSDIPTAAGSALVLWFLPAILSELIAGRGPDDDEDEFTWAAKLIGVYPFLMLVGIKDIASAIESGFDYQVTPAASAPGAMVKWARSVYKAVEEEDPEKAVKPTVEAVGYALQLPLKQPVITLGNIWDYMTGEDPEFEVRDLFFTKPKSRRN